MITLGRHVVATATALALGGVGAIAAQRPAHADGLSMTYTCTVPGMGSRTVALDGWLSSPGRASNRNLVDFQLHIASLGIAAPFAVDSWSASTWIEVRGAETSSFRLAGAGGYVAAGQPLSGDLTGTWAPTVRGTDLLSVGTLTISATSSATGYISAECLPVEPRPLAASLEVVPRYNGVWAQPILPPPYPYNPGWHRPPIIVTPPYNGGWHRPPIIVTPPHHPGWHRPPVIVTPPHHGGWNRPNQPPHHGGWNRPNQPPHNHHH